MGAGVAILFFLLDQTGKYVSTQFEFACTILLKPLHKSRIYSIF
jgi:hypothetical protein